MRATTGSLFHAGNSSVLSEHALRYGTRTGYIGSEVFVSLVDERLRPGRRTCATSRPVLCTSRDCALIAAAGAGDSSLWLTPCR